MKRLWILTLTALLAAWLLAGCPGGAEEADMWIAVSSKTLLPGQSVIISLMAPEDGVCGIRAVNSEGKTVSTIAAERSVKAGYNSLYWNGTWEGVACPPGNWRLVLSQNGREAETDIEIGRMIPVLIAPVLDMDTTLIGKTVTASYCASEPGMLRITATDGERERELFSGPVDRGEGDTAFPATLPEGSYRLSMSLIREDGTASEPRSFPLTVKESSVVFSPVNDGTREREDYTLNAWTLAMDITDEDAVWQALTAPVTVLDDGKAQAQRRQIVIRKEPSADSDGVGTATLASQGVHVLERGAEWSLIECYSSSFHDSPVLNWNVLVRGYVPTGYLKEIVPNQKMGLVVDKLTQRLYVFRDGCLYSTLLISTGLANEKQPYNETRSGEYLLVSKVGGFYSDNMFCPRAIRFNDGDLLHEVPYVITRDGIIDYSSTEPKLGVRASHGCIRVQRKENPEGINQEWLYAQYKENTKILIWEDWQGRQISIPTDETTFYWTPRKPDYYHTSDRCRTLKGRTVSEILYGELEEKGTKLKPCPSCGPVFKKTRLQEINASYAAGGDHDPILTEARKTCPRKKNER